MKYSSPKPSISYSLSGLRVACFYPWQAHKPTGAWNRFTSLWRFLHEKAGADVTLAFLHPGSDVRLDKFQTRHVPEPVTPFLPKMIDEWLKTRLELIGCNSKMIEILMRYEKNFYLARPTFLPWLDEIVSNHDAITCEYPLLVPLLAPVCRQKRRPLVVTCHDLMYELHGSSAKEKEILKDAELTALQLADALVSCNEDERQVLAKHGLAGVTVRNTSDVYGLPAGMDQAYRRAVVAELKLPTSRYCVFVGSAHDPNIEAVLELKKLAKAIPELSFVVVGSCAAQMRDGNMVALGQVSADLLDRVMRGAFAVTVPLLRGTGSSVKLFQALSYGKLIVSTPIGARGFPVEHERELLLTSRPQEFVAALRRLLNDQKLCDLLQKNARALAEKLDFRQEFSPYAEIILSLLERPKKPAVGPRGRGLILVDNNLVDRIGHHFNYALSIKEECAVLGTFFTALIKRTAPMDVVNEISARSVFTQGIHEEFVQNPYPPTWGNIRSTYDFLLANDCFARELAEGLEGCARLGDVIFLANATPRQMLGIALLLIKDQFYRQLKYVIMMRYSVVRAKGPIAARQVGIDQVSAEKYRFAFAILREVDTVSSVRFVTDSRRLAQEFEKITEAKPIGILPIPHTQPPLVQPTESGIPPKDSQCLRLVYLGDARSEKGFELLPAVIQLLKTQPTKVEFVLQAFISSPLHAPMQGVIDELQNDKWPHLYLLRSPLGTADYQALLRSSDIVLLPYDAHTYGARTSGALIEAICADKPVVVPGDSWLSEQIEATGAGATFRSGQAIDFARAVSEVIAFYPVYRHAAVQLGQIFRKTHNPSNFLHHLLQA